MPEKSDPNSASALSLWALRILVHWDALWANPKDYVRCARWWITGKKLRARLQLAPLLGSSRRAYRLWQAQRLQNDQVPPAPSADAPRILALIDEGDGADRTLESCINEGIAAKTVSQPQSLNELALDHHDWVLPLSAGDLLARGAGAHYGLAASEADTHTHVIYADDDALDAGRSRCEPHLKPDWNSELFRHFDFLTRASLLRVSSLAAWSGDDGEWATSLTHQAIAKTEAAGGKPLHIRSILHHRSKRPSPSFPLPAIGADSAEEALPCVSVIIPTRNRVDLLQTCLKGLQQTAYPGELDIIVIDNGSDDPDTCEFLSALHEDFARVIRDDGPFNFAALNNRAVERATGELLCFLNNDIEVMNPHWLTTLALQAMREDVGAVGARLLYPDGLIQHAGVVTGIGGAAAHAHRRLHPDEEGYFHRHSLPHFVSAVTAACMVMRRDRFLAVAGFDEHRFPVSFNDVDLCLRLRERGWMSLYEPRATLVHHESVSRGLDRDAKGAARQAQEVEALQGRWRTGLASADHSPICTDPYHHPDLSPLSESFVLRL